MATLLHGWISTDKSLMIILSLSYPNLTCSNLIAQLLNELFFFFSASFSISFSCKNVKTLSAAANAICNL
jgi:hypothetical protein